MTLFSPYKSCLTCWVFLTLLFLFSIISTERWFWISNNTFAQKLIITSFDVLKYCCVLDPDQLPQKDCKVGCHHVCNSDNVDLISLNLLLCKLCILVYHSRRNSTLQESEKANNPEKHAVHSGQITAVWYVSYNRKRATCTKIIWQWQWSPD